MRKWIDAVLNEARRGLAPIGEMRAKVFWNPRHEDMMRMLAKSTLGDLRGSFVVTETERLLAIWPARNLGHWNFHNECFNREGIKSEGHIDLRIVRELSVLTEERYWSRGTHYAGEGFYCAFSELNGHVGDPLEVPELKALLGPLKPIGDLNEAQLDERVQSGEILVNPSARDVERLAQQGDLRGLADGSRVVFWPALDMVHHHMRSKLQMGHDTVSLYVSMQTDVDWYQQDAQGLDGGLDWISPEYHVGDIRSAHLYVDPEDRPDLNCPPLTKIVTRK